MSSQARRHDALARTRLPPAAPRLKVSGAYARDADEEGPVVTFGYSRDHRPDLKQRLFGRTVTAEGLPVWGPVTDGHRSESPAHRFHLTPLRPHLPAVGAPLVVADSKFFAGETVALAAAHRVRFVTLGPQTVGLRPELVDAPELAALPLLWEHPGRRTGQMARDHGSSVVRPYRWKTETGAGPELTLRFRGVESTPLAPAKAPRLAAAQQTERATLAPRHQQWQRRAFACEAEAHQAATRCQRERSRHRHHLTYPVTPEWVPTKRGTRGRPPKGSLRPQRQMWRVRWQGQEAPEALAPQAQRERRFVLATDGRDAQQRTDEGLLRAYKGQPAGELSLKWAKNPAAIAPIFLETPPRIAALGCVSVIALLGYTRIARQVRKRRAERGATLPARPVCQLMRNMAVVTRVWAGQRHRPVTTISPVQLHVIGLLGYAESRSALAHPNST